MNNVTGLQKTLPDGREATVLRTGQIAFHVQVEQLPYYLGQCFAVLMNINFQGLLRETIYQETFRLIKNTIYLKAQRNLIHYFKITFVHCPPSPSLPSNPVEEKFVAYGKVSDFVPSKYPLYSSTWLFDMLVYFSHVIAEYFVIKE